MVGLTSMIVSFQASGNGMATLSASRVAEATMMRRSGRRRCTFFSSPSRVSVARLRSCASSTITTLHRKVTPAVLGIGSAWWVMKLGGAVTIRC